ncbi:GPW/gp25 family protein [bacterium]|nr:GPW/gp25 family protein [bacterium]
MADYVDLDYSFERNINNDVPLKYDKEAVKQSIIDILLTRVGEREFMPNYGSTLYWILFENMGVITQIRIRNAIEDALTNWEPRIRLNDILIEKKDTTWNIELDYTVIRIDQNDTLNMTLNTF